MKIHSVIILCCCLFLGTFANVTRYENFTVFKVEASNEKEFQELNDMIETEEYETLIPSPDYKHPIQVMIPPEKKEAFMTFVKKYKNMRHTLLVENLQSMIDEERAAKRSASFGWDGFYPLDIMYKWLDVIAAEHPNETSLFSIGKSFEDREIRGIKISYKPNNRGIFVEANIHAREWIASATATYLINELLNSKDTNVRNLAENFDWYIVPVLNVDGFVFSHEENRMWRKTRQPHSWKCIGADPNRNFDSFWMTGGASSKPCSDTYGGPKAFSEPETKALSTYILSINDKISVYVALHAYGQYILSPYGHTSTEFPKNYKDMMTIMNATANSIQKKYGRGFTFGSAAATIYVASGSSVDWAYNVAGIPMALTFEFRDLGEYGFVLPPNQIKPNCEEFLEGLLTLVQTSKKLRYL